MTKDKWNEIVVQEIYKLNIEPCGPEEWKDFKKELLLFINEVDKATEVYEMENKNDR